MCRVDPASASASNTDACLLAYAARLAPSREQGRVVGVLPAARACRRRAARRAGAIAGLSSSRTTAGDVRTRRPVADRSPIRRVKTIRRPDRRRTAPAPTTRKSAPLRHGRSRSIARRGRSTIKKTGDAGGRRQPIAVSPSNIVVSPDARRRASTGSAQAMAAARPIAHGRHRSLRRAAAARGARRDCAGAVRAPAGESPATSRSRARRNASTAIRARDPGPAGRRQDVHRRAHDLRPRRGAESASASPRRATRSFAICSTPSRRPRTSGRLDIRLRAQGRRAMRQPTRPRTARSPRSSGQRDALAMRLRESRRHSVLGGTAWLWARARRHGASTSSSSTKPGRCRSRTCSPCRQRRGTSCCSAIRSSSSSRRRAVTPTALDVSALEHVLGGHQTMPADRGLFLPVTWRLAPAICRVHVGGVLRGQAATRGRARAAAARRHGGSTARGLWTLSRRRTTGCQNASDEEVEAVARLVAELTAPGSQLDRRRATRHHDVTLDDILVVAPYNAQVGAPARDGCRPARASAPSTSSRVRKRRS